MDEGAGSGRGGLRGFYAGPAVGVPDDAVEIDFAAGVGLGCVEAVIKHPVLPGIVGDEIGIMARAENVFAARHQ